MKKNRIKKGYEFVFTPDEAKEALIKEIEKTGEKIPKEEVDTDIDVRCDPDGEDEDEYVIKIRGKGK